MIGVPAKLQRIVIERAQNRCEYCCLSQDGQEATFHIDHITPIVVGGITSEANLALACVSCSLRKGARQAAPDPETGDSVPLFHPRRDLWEMHFRWRGVHMAGLTSTGRTTINALKMNRSLILAIRNEELLVGRHPHRDKDSAPK